MSRKKVYPAGVTPVPGQTKQQFAKAHPFAPSSWSDGAPDEEDEANPETATAEGKEGFKSNFRPDDIPAASPYVMAALKKDPSARTLQEKTALDARKLAEEDVLKKGGKLSNGVTPLLVAETEGAKHGQFEGRAGATYNTAKNKELADKGFAPDGSPLTPETAVPGAKPATSTAPTAAEPTSGGTMTRGGKTTVVPGSQPGNPAPASVAPQGEQSPGGMPKPAGFAMRTMADGTVRTASGVNAAGSSNMRNFGTAAEAMEFYRPSAPAMAQAQQAPVQNVFGAGMPAGAGMALKTPGAAPTATGLPSADAVSAAVPKMPGGPSALLQDAMSMRTTSPTTQFDMMSKEMGTPSRKPSRQKQADDILNPFASSAS